VRYETIWGQARIVAIRDLTPDIREFTLVPDETPHGWQPGAHIDLEVMIDGLPEVRSYSLVGEPSGGTLRIAVKRQADSRGGSTYLHGLGEGARLRATAPKSAFEIDFAQPRHLLVAGGIGVTPLVGMAGALVRRGAEVAMAYTVRNAADLAYLDDLRAILGDRLKVHVSGEGQRLDLAALFASLAPGAQCAFCGPMSMLEAGRSAWLTGGRDLVDFRWETFGNSGSLPSDDFTVRIPRHNLEITVPRNRSLLDALRGAGVEIISDCRKGECGLCAMIILDHDGPVDHRDVFFSETEKAHNDRLCACVSRAVGTLTLDTDYRPDAI